MFSPQRSLATKALVPTLAFVIGVGCASGLRSGVVPAIPLPLLTHAAFFSNEMHVSPALDPQVFVRDPSAPAGVGPQQIAHEAGLRNARVTDMPDTPIYTATGARLDGFSLGSWLGAAGIVYLANAQIVVDLTGLRPGGVYSLFENHFDQSPVGFTPLDGTGATNTFVADTQGRAHVTVTAPSLPTHDNAVLVVYHSDGIAHGTSRGTIGANAHHQLIARIP
ncbi:hypothetical protein BH09GEM1_BH09GEM1_40960 [soil metagenome]